MVWTAEYAYDEFPLVEEEFGASLDVSRDPRGPDQLYDIVSRLKLRRGAIVLDVGCGDGRHTARLRERFGFAVTGSCLICCLGVSTQLAIRLGVRGLINRVGYLLAIGLIVLAVVLGLATWRAWRRLAVRRMIRWCARHGWAKVDDRTQWPWTSQPRRCRLRPAADRSRVPPSARDGTGATVGDRG